MRVPFFKISNMATYITTYLYYNGKFTIFNILFEGPFSCNYFYYRIFSGFVQTSLLLVNHHNILTNRKSLLLFVVLRGLIPVQVPGVHNHFLK